ncbi:hypothetical protein V6N13_109419 [Hibiscus sabdariffa]
MFHQMDNNLDGFSIELIHREHNTLADTVARKAMENMSMEEIKGLLHDELRKEQVFGQIKNLQVSEEIKDQQNSGVRTNQQDFVLHSEGKCEIEDINDELEASDNEEEKREASDGGDEGEEDSSDSDDKEKSDEMTEKSPVMRRKKCPVMRRMKSQVKMVKSQVKMKNLVMRRRMKSQVIMLTVMKKKSPIV